MNDKRRWVIVSHRSWLDYQYVRTRTKRAREYKEQLRQWRGAISECCGEGHEPKSAAGAESSIARSFRT